MGVPPIAGWFRMDIITGGTRISGNLHNDPHTSHHILRKNEETRNSNKMLPEKLAPPQAQLQASAEPCRFWSQVSSPDQASWASPDQAPWASCGDQIVANMPCTSNIPSGNLTVGHENCPCSNRQTMVNHIHAFIIFLVVHGYGGYVESRDLRLSSSPNRLYTKTVKNTHTIHQKSKS